MIDASVVIPSYNRRDYLAMAIDSVLAQTVQPRQIIVVDDGSKDDSADVVEQYARKTHGQVQLIRQANAGPSVARNRGLDQAEGKYLAFLDADDLWLPTRMEKLLGVLESDAALVGVYCPLFKFREKLDDMGRLRPHHLYENPTFETVFLTMCIQASTTLLRRERIAGLRFSEAARPAEDGVYFAATRLVGPWAFFPEALVAYRVHGAQVTADPMHMVDHVHGRVKWLHAQTHGLTPAVAADMEHKLWLWLIRGLETMYWNRQVADLTRLIPRIRELCPSYFSRSFLANKRIHPRWVYRVRDFLSRRRTP